MAQEAPGQARCEVGYVIPPGFSRVTFEHTPLSAVGSTAVWGLGIDDIPSETMLDLFQSWWEDKLRPLTISTTELRTIEMRNDTSVLDRPVNLTGELETTSMAPNTAALVRLTTGLVGRANRGRIYVPSVLPETGVYNDGEISPELRADILAAFTDLGLALGVLSASIVVLHSTSSDPTPVSSLSVERFAATQRRRLRA